MKNALASVMFCAPIVLFIVALVQFFTGFLPALIALQRVAHDLYGSPQDLQPAMLVQMTIQGMSSAARPFFAAAFLWRIDRHFAEPVKDVKE